MKRACLEGGCKTIHACRISVNFAIHNMHSRECCSGGLFEQEFISIFHAADKVLAVIGEQMYHTSLCIITFRRRLCWEKDDR